MSSFTRSKRFFLYKSWGKKCIYCSKKLSFKVSTLDHICPAALGGSNHVFNLALSCSPCNSSKSCKTLEDFVPFKTAFSIRHKAHLIHLFYLSSNSKV